LSAQREDGDAIVRREPDSEHQRSIGADQLVEIDAVVTEFLSLEQNRPLDWTGGL